MFIGYARVSTPEQKLRSQKDALRKAGCTRIFTDVASGAQASREGLEKVLAFLRERGILDVRYRRNYAATKCVHLDAMTEYHALAAMA